MHRPTALALAALGVAGLATAAAIALPAQAADPNAGRPLSAVLLGANEVAPGDPDGSGSAHVSVNPGTNEVCYHLTVSGIAPTFAAHIHSAPAGVNGPVVVTFVAPATGESSGCTTVDRELARAIVMTPSNYYVNVHNAEYPAGALRGQLG